MPELNIPLDYHPLPDLKFDVLCHKCNLGEGKAIGGCIAKDLTRLRLIVISDYPSYYETKEGYPMWDNRNGKYESSGLRRSHLNAGAYLRQVLTDLGLDTYREVYITNAIKCTRQKDKITNRQINPCVENWLKTELYHLNEANPTAPILIAGTVAHAAFKLIPNHPLTTFKLDRRADLTWLGHPIIVVANPATVCASVPRLESNQIHTLRDLRGTRDLSPLPGSPLSFYTEDLSTLTKLFKS
jgi:hypothetical protein